MTHHNQNLFDAIDAYLTGGEVREALATFAAGWALALAAGEGDSVDQAAERFTVLQLLENHEALAAYVLLQTRYSDAHLHPYDQLRNYLLIQDRTQRRIAPDVELPRAELVISAAVISAHISSGEFALAADLADRVANTLRVNSDRDSSDPATLEALSWFRLQAGHAYMSFGRFRDAQDVWMSIPAGSLGEGAKRAAVVAAGQLTIELAMGGTIAAARAAIERAAALAEESGSDERLPVVSRLTSLLQVELRSLDLPAARVARDRIMEAVGDGDHWKLSIVSVVAELSRLDGRSLEELAHLRSILHEFSADSMVPALAESIRYAQAGLLLALGRPGTAVRDLHLMRADAQHMFCFPSREAAGWLSVGLPQRAIERTDGCIAIRTDHNQFSWVQVLSVRSIAYAQLDRVDEARALVRELFAMVDDYGALALTYLPADATARLFRVAEAEHLRVPDSVRRAHELSSALLNGVYSTVGRLTPSERLLLRELRKPATMEEIAERSYKSPNTVKSHSRGIYSKLGATSRQHAVDIASSAGFYDLPAASTP